MAGEMEKTSNFDAWYAIYPNKGSRGEARRAYAKAEKNFDGAPMEFLKMCMHAVKAQIKFRQQQKAASVFVPNWKGPSPWLNQECWADPVALEPERKVTIGAQCSKPNCIHPSMGPQFTLCEEHYAWRKGMTLVEEVSEVYAKLSEECTTPEQWRAKFKSLAAVGLGGNLNAKKTMS